MAKTEIVYHDQTLFINLMGEYTSKNIRNLKSRMYSIIDQYGISDIVIDKKRITAMDSGAFYDMLDDYDIKYGGNLIVDE